MKASNRTSFVRKLQTKYTGDVAIRTGVDFKVVFSSKFCIVLDDKRMKVTITPTFLRSIGEGQ